MLLSRLADVARTRNVTVFSPTLPSLSATVTLIGCSPALSKYVSMLNELDTSAPSSRTVNVLESTPTPAPSLAEYATVTRSSVSDSGGSPTGAATVTTGGVPSTITSFEVTAPVRQASLG